MVLESSAADRSGAATARRDRSVAAIPPALVWRYSLTVFLTGFAFMASLGACFGGNSSATLVRLRLGDMALQTSTLVLLAAAALMAAALKLQSTQSRLSRITWMFEERRRSGGIEAADDDLHTSLVRDDVPDSSAFYAAGGLCLFILGFALFHARAVWLAFLVDQGTIVTGLVAAIACVTPIVLLLIVIGLIEGAMRRVDVPGLLAPVMGSCGIFVAFMLVQVTHLAQ